MAIGRISGGMLHSNLERQGVDLAFDGNLTYLDVTNRRVGINTDTPDYELDVNGNVRVSDVTIVGNVISSSNGITIDGNISADNVMSDRGFDQNNWNTLTQIGVYAINRVSWSGVTGAPTDSLVFTGLLEVLSSSNLSTVQIFRPNDGSEIDPNVEFIRSKFSTGSWTAWVKMVNNFQIVDCGSF